MSTPNTSATGGPLLPASALPLDGLAFDQFLQSVVVGLVPIPGNMVFPRWQPDAEPPQPPLSADWAAIGELNTDRQGFAYASFNPADNQGQGSVTQISWAQVEVMATFYGPNSVAYANMLKDGLQIGQNRDLLRAQDIAVADLGNVVRMPEMIGTKWVNRADLSIHLNRLYRRTYPIFSILSTSGTFLTDAGNIAAPYSATLE
jgi:hypothetical protein